MAKHQQRKSTGSAEAELAPFINAWQQDLAEDGYSLLNVLVDGKPSVAIVDDEDGEKPLFVAVTEGMDFECELGEHIVTTNIAENGTGDSVDAGEEAVL